MRRHLLLLVGIAILPASCGGGSGSVPGIEGSPEAAVEQVLEMVHKQQWAREWESLHPDQQAMVPRDKFVSCSKAADDVRIGSVTVLEVHDKEVPIPGTSSSAATKAVTAEYEVVDGARTTSFVDTFYLFDVDGRWRWVLSTGSVEAYQAGSCPA